LLYRSPDLRHWEYLHPLCVGDLTQTEPLWTGSMWECPDFFPLGDRHVLLMSVWDEEQLHYTAYQTGRYANHRFTPQTVAKLDYGDNHFYAPQTMRDAQGRRLIWGWVQEGRSQAAQIAAGWSGLLSLPRVLALRADGGVRQEPVPELRALRRAHQQFTDLALAPGQDQVLDGVRGDMLEIVAEFEPGDAQQVGLKVRCAPDGAEETRIVYDVATQQLALDRERASLDLTVDRLRRAGALPLATGEPLTLHVFLDRSVIEVFANGGRAITSRVYPTRPDSLGVAAFALGGPARLTSVDIWELASIWEP
jgi:beta-fructofuranosidase